uniref:uncharacterized protein LOC109966293 isoform X1 n=1 Tax=Monopterus albus TaxID=43700 RepID=UPI0009B34746|nr:uncharacterized protein LOC109966293 isoform X1 [Monopterus albus]XP_020466691.1 uncharacterized protein LOC109966293 isoform X1 [Monopterus albus]XP_020466692.1 uncharacterized protein LOC109966293 isoform X1 [Monopterus albus]
MGTTALLLLCLVPVFTCATQERLRLNVTPKITAEYGKQVVLQCSVSSMSPNTLAIKHMEWSQNKTPLCSVDSEGNVTIHNRTASDFNCIYKSQELSLIFRKVQPLESGKSTPYMCKLRSDQGVRHEYSTVELEECCGHIEGILTSQGPACTFSHVYPDGDVHWFHGSHSFLGGSLGHNTTKRVEEGGWLTIHSSLERDSSDEPYNCSLKSTVSGTYIASTMIPKSEFLHSSAVRSLRPVRTAVGISILLAVTLK